MTETAPPRSKLKQVRILLWILVALALAGSAALLLMPRAPVGPPQAMTVTNASFGGPFTLTGADGKPFASARLTGKPYAIFFGFTRCGDVCPTTLARLVKLRQAAGGPDQLSIVFVTIDPANDGPKEVGQYAQLFNSPIIGLTGSDAQIDQVKKQYGIYAEPTPHAGMGQQFAHTGSVLLFGGDGRFAGTIAANEPDNTALDKLKQITT